jgi:hypothetical protein
MSSPPSETLHWQLLNLKTIQDMMKRNSKNIHGKMKRSGMKCPVLLLNLCLGKFLKMWKIQNEMKRNSKNIHDKMKRFLGVKRTLFDKNALIFLHCAIAINAAYSVHCASSARLLGRHNLYPRCHPRDNGPKRD